MNSKLSFVEIDLDALISNYKVIYQHAEGQRVAAVIKGNAYGLGRKKIFESLFSANCREFFVADWQEALDLKQPEAKIYALSGAAPEEQPIVARLGITPVFYSMQEAMSWYELYGTSRECALHLETGLNRLGFLTEEVLRLTKLLKVSFLLNHFACGYTPQDSLNQQQAKKAIELSKKTGIPLSIGSSCMFNLDEKLMKQSDLIRIGRYLYGIRANLAEHSPLFGKLKPVAKLFSRLIACKELEIGEQVGYDHGFVATQKTRIGVLNLGYRSGCILKPGKSYVFAKGQNFPVISHAMDYTMIDLAEKEIPIGERFEIFGENLDQYSSGIGIIMPSASIQQIYVTTEGILDDRNINFGNS